MIAGLVVYPTIGKGPGYRFGKLLAKVPGVGFMPAVPIAANGPEMGEEDGPPTPFPWPRYW